MNALLEFLIDASAGGHRTCDYLTHEFHQEGVMSDENIEKLKMLASQLVEFADYASDRSDDDRCFLLYGLTKDCAYKILAEAEREWNNHIAQRKAMSRDQ